MAKSDTTKGRGTRETAAKRTPRKTAEAGEGAAPRATRARGAAGGGRDLKAELRDFASARPEGWSHDDWLNFLDHLREKGYQTDNPDEIGMMLERERLATTLEQVEGMGPKRVDAVVGRFDTVWSLRQADTDEIAAVPGMNRALAERVKAAVG